MSDLKKEIAESFGVLSQEDGVALRGLFIIDKEGVVQHSTINNLAFGRNVDETIRTLQALQYVQVRDSSAPRGSATHRLRHAQLSASRARAARAHTLRHHAQVLTACCAAALLTRAATGQPGRGVPRRLEAR